MNKIKSKSKPSPAEPSKDGEGFRASPCSAFLRDFSDARVIWGRADAWRGEIPTLAMRAWKGLQYSAAHADDWGRHEQVSLESAQIEFEIRQRPAFSSNTKDDSQSPDQ